MHRLWSGYRQRVRLGLRPAASSSSRSTWPHPESVQASVRRLKCTRHSEFPARPPSGVRFQPAQVEPQRPPARPHKRDRPWAENDQKLPSLRYASHARPDLNPGGRGCHPAPHRAVVGPMRQAPAPRVRKRRHPLCADPASDQSVHGWRARPSRSGF